MLRMIIQPSAPMWGAVAAEVDVVESGRKPERSNVFGKRSHQPKMAAGSKGQAKTDM